MQPPRSSWMLRARQEALAKIAEESRRPVADKVPVAVATKVPMREPTLDPTTPPQIKRVRKELRRPRRTAVHTLEASARSLEEIMTSAFRDVIMGAKQLINPDLDTHFHGEQPCQNMACDLWWWNDKGVQAAIPPRFRDWVLATKDFGKAAAAMQLKLVEDHNVLIGPEAHVGRIRIPLRRVITWVSALLSVSGLTWVAALFAL